PRWHVVGRAIRSPSEEASWAYALSPAFDPREIVVLEGTDPSQAPSETRPGASWANATPADPPEGKEKTPIEVLSDLPASKRLRLRREQPGWLVLTQPWYPGWRARVNGVETPIRPAN